MEGHMERYVGMDVLERIAEGYERDAAREDQGAEQRDWT